MKLSHILAVLISSILVIGCIPEFKKVKKSSEIEFENTAIQNAYRLAKNGAIDSLKTYLNDSDPAVRKTIAISASTGENPAILPLLFSLLKDTNSEVSTAAAYAIGQIKDPSSTTELLNAYDAHDTLGVKQNHNAAILEAIGKVGDTNALANITSIKTFKNSDTLLLLGQMRALQHFGSRKMLNQKSIELLLEKVSDEETPEGVRVLAANIIGNEKELNIKKYEQRLFNIFKENKNPLIKMAVIKPLKDTKNYQIQKGIVETLGFYDPLVTINTVKTVSNFPYKTTFNKTVPLLNSKDQQVALTVVDYIKKCGLRGSQTDAYRNYLKEPASKQTQIALQGAILNNLPKGFGRSRKAYSQKLKDIVVANTNENESISALRALANDPDNYPFLLEQINPDNGLLSTAAAESLNSLILSDRFSAFFRNGTNFVKKQITDSIKEKLSINTGVTSVIGNILSNEKLGLKTFIDNSAFLDTAIANQKLPEDLEALYALEQAKAYIEGYKFEPKKYTPKAISWDILSKVGSGVKAEFVTNKGSFIAELYPQRAPQSVANFIELANSDYFNNKKIHRVVPNFVMQSGCSRGDGYGSLDYTINSEVSQSYFEDEGYLGMASLGYNTESSQWFVTLSPAIHLSGKYTIFGKIISGMDVVKTANIGDKINKVIITK